MKGLSASEALYGFMGWLTSFDKPVTFSCRHYAGTAAELVDEFCKENNLSNPRNGWHENFTYPKSRPTMGEDDLAIGETKNGHVVALVEVDTSGIEPSPPSTLP